jgi:hypothetical protein
VSFDATTLYELLPAIHRIRDAEQRGELKDFLAIIAEQVAVLEEDLAQLYDDQFIETCADWAAPYVGSLIGYRALHGVVPQISSPRAEVANTIAYRRRKGTATMLEQLARDITGWRAHAVEFFQRLATTQYLNHLRPQSAYTADLRDWEALERAGTAFDRQQHTVDLRSIARGRGRYAIPNIGLFLWRLAAFPLERAMPVRVDNRRFLFNPLGIDTQLFTNPETEESITHLATPLNVPAPISRRVLASALESYYGAGKSLLIETRSVPNNPFTPVPLGEVTVCDLHDRPGNQWSLSTLTKTLAIDPVLGRCLFRDAQPAGTELRVTFNYGFSADMGGGPYERGEFFAGGLPSRRVSENPPDKPTIQAALDDLKSTGGIVEIMDNRTYEEALSLELPAGTALILRAHDGRRPVLKLTADLTVAVTGPGGDASVTLEGLLIAGRPLALGAPAAGLRRLTLRHMTLVPGRTLNIEGQPAGSDPSLIADLAGAEIVIAQSIVGALRVSPRSRITISDSIVDATAASALAYGGIAANEAGGALTLTQSTVIGKMFAGSFDLISNAILVADPDPAPSPPPIRAERIQQGCVRFSYVPASAMTPRRYRCQPEHEIAEQIEARERETGAPLSNAEKSAIRAAVLAWLKPGFTSLRYGRPGYLQLARSGPAQIAAGADDEAEMGAFHSLFQPQRETNLKVRLEEYLRFGLEAGLFYET